MDSLSHPLIVGIGVLGIMQPDRHCWNWCSRNNAIGSILRSRVYDVDTNYHNLSTKTLDLKDQAFVGEDNCVILTSCQALACMMWIQSIIICQRRCIYCHVVLHWTLKTKLSLAKLTVFCQKITLKLECFDFNSNDNHPLIVDL
ncbi:hypothetical protein HanPSC8_Chr09g0372021 [Helianthus annuus]|nr:hypothetical protein HanIR_Chr09g0416541 [Helianthus annuus]KAJ0892946.1 hypothetical protein HanPSC8_Chr09g0372021 [Helianthus annuus]